MKKNICSLCGDTLTQEEYEEFEDECSNCVFEGTSGIIHDKPEKELDFE